MEPEPDVDIEALAEVLARAAGLDIPDEHRAAVIAYLDLTLRIARPMLDFEPAEASEPAPVYRP